MTFVKVVKNKAYFKRFQVKYRRRRECKTDYYARKRLTAQDKNKYNQPRYRLVVRTTNTDVICQIIYATLEGDRCFCAAYSHEFPNFGFPKVGLTNYAACYAVGLLCARRMLTKVNLADKYEGNTEVTGEDEEQTKDTFWDFEGPKPFKALLDVGINSTSTGARVFAAMKGASDGGLFVPHNNKRLIGYDNEAEEEDDKFSAERLRHYIFGGHISDYMKHLKEEDSEKYQAHFSRYLKAGLNENNLEEKYGALHAAIRAKPAAPAAKKVFKAKRKDVLKKGAGNKKRLNLKERKNRIKQKKLYLQFKLQRDAEAAAADSDSD